MHEVEPTPPTVGYFSITPVLWMRQQRSLNIILDLLCAISSQIHGPSALKKNIIKRAKSV